jgi:glutathione S-transferase
LLSARPDFYLFVILLWAERASVEVPSALVALRQRMASRPRVTKMYMAV